MLWLLSAQNQTRRDEQRESLNVTRAGDKPLAHSSIRCAGRQVRHGRRQEELEDNRSSKSQITTGTQALHYKRWGLIDITTTTTTDSNISPLVLTGAACESSTLLVAVESPHHSPIWPKSSMFLVKITHPRQHSCSFSPGGIQVHSLSS